MRETTIRIAPRGLATSFTESELPPEYALEFKNRTIDRTGGAAKRQGIVETGTAVPAGRLIDAYHEFVAATGTATLFASTGPRIWRQDASAWTQVHEVSGSDKLRSVQFGNRLIFYNEHNRPFFTDDAGVSFEELKAIVEQGVAGVGTVASGMTDPDIDNWATQTDVNDNDILFIPALSAYGVISIPVTATPSSILHSEIGASGTGIGKATRDLAQGDRYEIIDSVALNVVQTETIPDNVAVAATGSTPTSVEVSGLNFGVTEARVGDWVVNTTRNALTRIEAIATALTVTSVAGQVAGDSLVFLKSAMPIASYAHTHYNRLYLVDARDQRKIRISGANDPTDFTSDGATLDPITVNFDLRSQGDRVLALQTFQRFLAICGRRAIYLFQGTNPIGEGADFTPVAMFPQGLVSPDGVVSLGNDLAFVTDDGVQSLSQLQDSSNISRVNLSEPVRASLRGLIEDVGESGSRMLLVHYPRRAWLLFVIGSEIYCYNYEGRARGPRDASIGGGSWALFDGPFAQQTAYLVRADGSLICGGGGGRTFRFDSGAYADDGQAISTTYQTGWLTLESASESSTRIKHLKYMKPLLQAPNTTTFEIGAEGGFEGWGNGSADLITLGATDPIGDFAVGASKIGGSGTANIKAPLRCNGEVMRFTFRNSTTTGPDVIGRYTLYSAMMGQR